MPKNEWRRSGAKSWRKLVEDHAGRCAGSMWSDGLFQRQVAGFVALAFVECGEDEEFLGEMRACERALGDGRPSFGYRLMQFRACLRAFRRCGTLGREEIPFEVSGELEKLALGNMDGGVEGNVEA